MMRSGGRRCRRHGGRVFTDELVHSGRSMGGDMRRGRGSVKRLHFGRTRHFAVLFSLYFYVYLIDR